PVRAAPRRVPPIRASPVPSNRASSFRQFRPAAFAAVPGAAHVQPPCPVDRVVADESEKQRQQWQSDYQWLPDRRNPVQRRRYPFAESLALQPERERWQRAFVLQKNELPELEGDVVERDDGEGIGIDRHQHGNRQVDAACDSEKRARGELDRVAARYEARKQPGRHPAGHRPAIEMPQVGVLAPRAEPRDMAVCPYRIEARQESTDELAGHRDILLNP